MTDPTRQLDSFESDLLTELKRHVVDQPAPLTTPVRRRRRLLAVAATGIAASTAAVLGLTTLGGSPAYAVNTNADGDVVVTVHRLDDAAGLEKALADKGIDADVSYDPNGHDGPTSVGIGPDGEPQFGEDAPPPPEGAITQEHGSLSSSGGSDEKGLDQGGLPVTEAKPAGSGDDVEELPIDDMCGTGDPADLDKVGADWVLTIPADSPLMDRHVTIGTDADGGLSVFFAGNEPGSFCGVMEAKRQQAP